MNLLSENQYKKTEKRKGKKIVLILLNLSIVLVIIIIALMIVLGSQETVGITLYINDQQQEISDNLIIQDNQGNQYIELERLAHMLGYQFDNSEYQTYGVDTTKCYIRNENLISGFELDSNRMYKYEIGTNLDYQYYTLNHNIIIYNNNNDNKLYIALDDLIEALNLYCTIDENNVIRISTMAYLSNSYQQQLQERGYTLATDQNNQKALAYGWIIVSKDNVWSVLNTNFEEIIGAKFASIYFDEINLNYIVSNSNGKYGIIDNTGVIEQSLKYDGLEPLNYENMLYKVKNNSQYGIMKSDGTMLTQIIYDEIGYPAEPQSNILYTLIIPELENETEKTIVVKQNGKYGLIYLETGETFLPCDHLDKLYSVNELGEVEYKVEVQEQTLDLLQYLELRNLITVDLNQG